MLHRKQALLILLGLASTSAVCLAEISPEVMGKISDHIQYQLVPTTIGVNYCYGVSDSYALIGKFWGIIDLMSLTEAETQQIQTKLDENLKPFEAIYLYDLKFKDWPKENKKALKKLCRGKLKEFNKEVYTLSHLSYNACNDAASELIDNNMQDKVPEFITNCMGFGKKN